MSERICAVPGCGRPFKKKGYCQSCYNRAVREGTYVPTPLVELQQRGCKVAGCTRRHCARGYCEVCYRRVVIKGRGEALPKPPVDRILDRVDTGTVIGDCWNWTGLIRPDGYAVANWHGKHRGAHRVVYELLVEPIPAGLELDHLCFNRSCVNPDHLEPVTHRVNGQRVRTFYNTGYASRSRCRSGRHDITKPGAIFARKSGERTCYACLREAWKRSKARTKERNCGLTQPPASDAARP